MLDNAGQTVEKTLFVWLPRSDAVEVEVIEERPRRVRAVLAEQLDGWPGKYPDVAVESVVVRDQPAVVLVERSDRAQLVVVGSHSHGAMAAVLLDSVGHAVLHRASCPVAIVRPAAATSTPTASGTGERLVTGSDRPR